MIFIVFCIGIFVGAFAAWVIMTLCDRHAYRHMIQHYREHLRKQQEIRNKKATVA